jgi:hypothetical protein
MQRSRDALLQVSPLDIQFLRFLDSLDGRLLLVKIVDVGPPQPAVAVLMHGSATTARGDDTDDDDNAAPAGRPVVPVTWASELFPSRLEAEACKQMWRGRGVLAFTISAELRKKL